MTYPDRPGVNINLMVKLIVGLIRVLILSKYTEVPKLT